MSNLRPNVSSVELFERYLPRFHEVTLKAFGFYSRSFHLGYTFTEATQKNYDETRLFSINVIHKSGAVATGAKIRIDGMALGTLNFDLNPGNPRHPFVQLEQAIAEAITERLLTKRRFFLDHQWKDNERYISSSSDNHLETVTVEGGEVGGLQLPCDRSTYWQTFIPKGVEQTIVEKAKEIEEVVSHFNWSMNWVRTTENEHAEQRRRVKASMVKAQLETEEQLARHVEQLQTSLDELIKTAG